MKFALRLPHIPCVCDEGALAQRVLLVLGWSDPERVLCVQGRHSPPGADGRGAAPSPVPSMPATRPSTAWAADPSHHRSAACSPTHHHHHPAAAWPQAPSGQPDHSFSHHPHVQPGMQRPATATAAEPQRSTAAQPAGWPGTTHAQQPGPPHLPAAPAHHGTAMHVNGGSGAPWAQQHQEDVGPRAGRAHAHSSPGSVGGHRIPAGEASLLLDATGPAGGTQFCAHCDETA